MKRTVSNNRLIRSAFAFIVVGCMLLAAKPAAAQFGAGQYGNLVWDPEKQCWIRIDRRGHGRRLLEEDVLYIPGRGSDPGTFIAEGMPYHNMGGEPKGVTIIDGVGGTVTSQSPQPTPQQIADFQAAIDRGEVPTTGPTGQPLGPGARAFLAGFTEEGGYGNVGGGEYGDVPDDYSPMGEFEKEDKSGIASSVHIKDYGTFYLSNNGNLLHDTGFLSGNPGRGDYTTTTNWTGLGEQTYYPYGPNRGDAGSLTNVTYNMDPTTDRITSVDFTFNGGGSFRLDPNSGNGCYIDPFPPSVMTDGNAIAPDSIPGTTAPMPILVMQYNPNNKQLPWVQPRKNDPPKKKKVEPKQVDPKNLDDLKGLELGADWDPTSHVGLGHDWQVEFDRNENFDAEPVRGVEPSIKLSFLGPPPGSMVDLEASSEEIGDKADAATEYIAKFTETLALIGAQEKIAQLQSDAVNKGADEVAKKVKDILIGQAEALAGGLLSNADKLQKVYDKMPAGARKDKLGGFLSSGFWQNGFAKGGSSAASGGLLIYQTFKDGQLGGDDAVNWFFSDFLAGKKLPNGMGALVGQAKAFADTMVAYGQFANVSNDLSELLDTITEINRNVDNLNNWVDQNQHVVTDYYNAVANFTNGVINETDGMDGLDRVRMLNDAISMLESTSNGLDINEELNQLREERDGTVIMLPGGEWGTEPVLYERLWLVPNAAKRYGMLLDARMTAMFGPGWNDFSDNRPPPGMVMLPLYPPDTGDEPEVQPGTGDTTPAPPPADDDGDSGSGTPPTGTPISLPDGTTATVPPGGAGPIRMADGTRIYNYPNGDVERVFVMPSGATVTHRRGGGIEVTAPDGTITQKSPGGYTRVIHPNGVIVTQDPNGNTVTDTDDGVVIEFAGGSGNDFIGVQPGGIVTGGGIPVLGDFEPQGTDEIGLFSGNDFYLDTDQNLDAQVDGQDFLIWQNAKKAGNQ